MPSRKGKSSVTTAERIQTHVEALPPPLQQEVLDFVEYLRLKAKQDQDVPLHQRRAWTKEDQRDDAQPDVGEAGTQHVPGQPGPPTLCHAP